MDRAGLSSTKPASEAQAKKARTAAFIRWSDAAERGARHALSDVGLDGPDAANDIRELRNLLDAFNEAKKTAGLTLVKMLVTGLVLALLAGTIVKIKLFGGPQ